MRKKSILMVCISALIALTMFVGCDNAPVLPSFVVGGNVTQTGDFLTGQNFDPSKFSVTVTYDNGKIVAADDTVSVMIVGDETVEAGDTAIVDFGIDYKGNHVTKEVAIAVYNINTITVEGPASYALDAKPLNSDFTVTANYGEGKTMPLNSTEFMIGAIEYENNVKPTAANPTVKASVEVTPLVGNKVVNDAWAVKAEHSFDCTYEATAELPGPVEGIRISKAVNVSVINIPAMNDVYPSFEDYKIEVLIPGYTENGGWYTLTEDPGVVLTYVDEYGDDLKGNLADIDPEADIAVKAEYEGFVDYLERTNNLAIITPVLTVKASEDFEVADSYIVKSALPALTSEGLSATFSVGSEKIRVNAEDLSVAFYNGSEQVVTTAPETAGEVYVRVSYRGVLSDSIKNVAITAAPEISKIKTVTLANGFTLVKQIYDELPKAVEAVSSVTVVLNDKASSEVVIPAADFAKNGINVVFTTDEAGMLSATKDLTSAASVYAKVLTNSVAAVAKVTLVEPVVDELSVTVAYEDENIKAPLIGKKMTIAPKLTTTAGGTLSISDVMYVDTATGHYTTLTSPVTLDKDNHTYKAVVWYNDELMESEEFEIPAGIGYVNIGKSEISTEITVAKVNTYVPFVDDPISDDPDNYAVSIKTADKAVGGAVVTITGIEFPADQKIQSTGNKVWANISYIGPTGETITGKVEVTAFAGNPYVEAVQTPSITMNGTPITQLPAGTYDLRNLVVAGLTAHGDISWSLTAKANNGSASVNGNEFTTTAYGGVTVTLSWFDGTEVQSKEFVVNAN